MVRDLVIGMAGSGGDGIVSAGESLISACAIEGYNAMMTKSFGSQIRGGESSCRVRLSTAPVLNPGGALDVAVVLDWEDFAKFGAELPVDRHTVVLYEEKTGVRLDALPLSVAPAEAIAVPFGDMARKATGNEKGKNSVVLGLLSGWFGIPGDGLLAALRKKFAAKGEALVTANEEAFALGTAFAAAHPLAVPRTLEAATRREPMMLVDGNDVCAAAAIFAGCEFFGGYPITPSTEIMQFFTREIWKYGGVVLQAEDEIAGIGAALGASFGGKKAMTATSGPGMSLKAEMMGLATIAELPLVIVDVQRGGPSTGMPTKSEQADLFQAVFSAHGDVVRPVLAPTCVADTFDVTVEAFNLAEQYQTPVIVLSDQEIAQRKEVIGRIDPSRFTLVERLRPSASELAPYERFRLTPDGISPIAHPGMAGGNYVGAGIEHNAHGDPTANGRGHQTMNEKRHRKLDPLRQRDDLFTVYGDPGAPLALVAWGSIGGVCREAVALAEARGLRVKLLVPRLLFPVNEAIYRHFFSGVRAGLVVEQSYLGQLHRVLRMAIDVPPAVAPFCRSGANPFAAAEVVERLVAHARALGHDPADGAQP